MELLVPSKLPRSDDSSFGTGHESPAPAATNHPDFPLVRIGAASEAVESSSFLERSINIAEKITGLDLDRDGDIGQAGHQTKPKLKITDVAVAATMASRSHFFHEDRHGKEMDDRLVHRWWLDNTLMYRAVENRSGADSWEAKVVRFLQSRLISILLIALLLCDVFIVFAELYLETEHPSCKVIRRNSFNCCPASHGVALSEPGPHSLHSFDGPDLHGAEAFLQGLVGVSPHSSGHRNGCEAPTVASHDEYRVGCDLASWAHLLHELFSCLSLLILFAFQVEVAGLLIAFRELFVRSKGYLLDFVVVSLSLGLQWYVLLVELGVKDPFSLAAHGLLDRPRDDTDPLGTLEEIQSVVLIARLWRFIRVGHGIATSMQDMVHQTKTETQGKIDELRNALRQLEGEISTGNFKARASLAKVHEQVQALSGHGAGS